MQSARKAIVGEITWGQHHRLLHDKETNNTHNISHLTLRNKTPFRSHVLTPTAYFERQYRISMATFFLELCSLVVLLATVFYFLLMLAYAVDPRFW